MARFVLCILHLSLWAQLGVLSRVYLDKLFQDGCTGSWGLCLTSTGVQKNTLGAYFVDLPSNIVGSFVIGVLAAATTPRHFVDKAVAILPESHPWQCNPELHVGLRTGYCGSLTTFSSWQSEAVALLIGGKGRQGGQWDQWLWAEAVGVALSLAALVVGEHVAEAINYTFIRKRLHAGQLPAVANGPPGGAGPADLRPAGSGFLELEGGADDIDSVCSESERSGAGRLARHSLGSNLAGQAGGDDVDEAARDLRLSSNTQAEPVAAQSAHRTAQQDQLNKDVTGNGGRLPLRTSAPQDHVVSLETAAPQTAAGEDNSAQAGATSWKADWLAAGWLTHTATAALLVATTTIWSVLAGLDDGAHHVQRRSQWFSILAGPFGAILRWQLSKLNHCLPGRLKWLPAGTFAANMLACAMRFAANDVLQVVVAPGYWLQIWMTCIQVGFCGALSTVSTFVVEVKGLMKQGNYFSQRSKAYVYILLSCAGATLLGVIIYGSAVWASS